MAKSSQPFGPQTGAELVQLVREQPLAWIVSGAGATFGATLLPLLPTVSPDGRLNAFTGHFARSNPQYAELRRDSRATILLLGASGYISPSWMSDRRQAPTWNYASAHCLVDIEFHDDEGALRAHLDELVDTMEAGRPARWRITEMGPRYDLLARRIVTFVAHVREIREKYKLGQDERDDVFADIVTALSDNGDAELLEWMRRLNPGRGSCD